MESIFRLVYEKAAISSETMNGNRKKWGKVKDTLKMAFDGVGGATAIASDIEWK